MESVYARSEASVIADLSYLKTPWIPLLPASNSDYPNPTTRIVDLKF